MPKNMKVTAVSETGGFNVTFTDDAKKVDETKGFYFELTNQAGTKKYSLKDKEVLQDLAKKIQKSIKQQKLDLAKLDEVDFFLKKNKAEPSQYVLEKVTKIDSSHKSDELSDKKLEKVRTIFQNIHPGLSQAKAIVSSPEKESSSSKVKSQSKAKLSAKDKASVKELLKNTDSPENRAMYKEMLGDDLGSDSDIDSAASTSESDSDDSGSDSEEVSLQTKQQKAKPSKEQKQQKNKKNIDDLLNS